MKLHELLEELPSKSALDNAMEYEVVSEDFDGDHLQIEGVEFDHTARKVIIKTE